MESLYDKLNFVVKALNKTVDKGKFILHNTIETNKTFKSLKEIKVNLIYYLSSKKQLPVIEIRVNDKYVVEEDIKRVNDIVSTRFCITVLNFVNSQQYKDMKDGKFNF